MTTVNPRSITDAERRVLEEELTIDDLGFLAGQIKDRLGYPDQVARGVVGWVAMKSAGLPDETSPTTRAQYRKVLRELGALVPSPDGTDDRFTSRRKEAGMAQIISILAGTAVGATALTQSPAVAAVGIASLVITYPAGFCDSGDEKTTSTARIYTLDAHRQRAQCGPGVYRQAA